MKNHLFILRHGTVEKTFTYEGMHDSEAKAQFSHDGGEWMATHGFIVDAKTTSVQHLVYPHIPN